jgi:hypothetical protein
MFGVKLAGRFGMMLCMKIVTMGRVGVLGGSRDIFALVMLRRLSVVVCRLLVMQGRFFVMVSDLIRMGHGMLSRIERGRSARAQSVSIACYRTGNYGVTVT